MVNRDRPDLAHDAFYKRSATPPSLAIEVPKLALPTGGGAIKAIDEKFVVNAVNGTSSFGLPLPLTPGRAMPSVSLSYDSGHGNGTFGLGWALDTPSIARRTDKHDKRPEWFPPIPSSRALCGSVNGSGPTTDARV